MFAREKKLLHGVPVYIEKSKLPSYLAEAYYLYSNHLKFLSEHIQKYDSYAKEKRADYFNALKEAFMQNAENVSPIVKLLENEISVSSYESVRINPNDNVRATLKDFVYLRRDWCFLEESEAQLSRIGQSFKEALSEIKFETQNTLFLGCGVGRVAADLSDIFQKIYATDKSFSMIWHLQKLLQGEAITFYTPQLKNIEKTENAARKHIAKIPGSKLSRINGKIEAFVSDVLDLPFGEKKYQQCFFRIFYRCHRIKIMVQSY